MFHRFQLIPSTTIVTASLALALSGCSKDDAGGQTAEAAKPAATAATVAQAETPAAQPDKAAGTTYGDGVQGAARVAIADLMADPRAYEGKTVQVEGTVADVCPKRGCWFEMAGQEPGDKVRFKVQDGVMVFPMDAKGKHAVAEGVVVAQTLSLEDTRKYLEYQAKEYGKDDVDPASVTEPMTIIRLDGKGAVITDGK